MARANCSAIGERIAFIPQTKRIEPGVSGMAVSLSAPMEDTDEREEPPGGIKIDVDLARQAIHQSL